MTNPDNSPKTEATEGAAKKQLNFLVICADLTFAKSVQTSILTLQASHPDINYRIFPGVNKEKIIECLEKLTVHSILVEEEVINDRTTAQYLTELRDIAKKNPANVNVPIIFVAQKTELEKTMTLIREGWKDVFLKPLDQSLFLQKLSLYNTAEALLEEPILFTMDLAKDVDLSFRYKTKSVSEYGLKVISSKPIEPGSVVGVSGALFALPLAASVLDCTKVADDQFMVNLIFVGINPADTQAIRKLIRHEYAEEKQAA